MSNGHQQAEEIKTIREKKISVRLSEADCNRVSNLCGEYNITVGELIENFIGDLVNGTYTNGSGERMFARQYVERCGFSFEPDRTLTNWILASGYMYAIDDIYYLFDGLQTGQEELEYLEQHPEEADAEAVEILKSDMEDWEQELDSLKAKYLKAGGRTAEDWEKEVESFMKWWQEKERFMEE